jgi:hypothetical protein
MAVALTAAACDWPMPGHGPARTGSSPDQSISRQALTTDSLELSWTASLQEGVWDATPVVADGTVYAGGGEGQFLAFDATGHEAGDPKCLPTWTGDTAAVVPSPPVVADGRSSQRR